MEKIVVYGPTELEAARLAADMNLALRQWEYRYERFVWADVGGLLERLDNKEENDGSL